MSMSIGPSSSLAVLERYNHSKSTVSSSDTDVSSAGYASSSGTTTPEDDTQTFHFGPTLQDVLAHRSRCAPREKLTIVTKPRNLSSAMKKVKKVAYALIVFKKKRPDDVSPILITSPLRERFGKRMSVKPHPDEGFYSLPNRRFSLSDVSMPPEKYSQTITRKFGTISGSASTPVNGTFKRPRSSLNMVDFADVGHTSSTPTVATPTEYDGLTFHVILVHVLRISLFVPWCAAVGGALLLFPAYVELVAFSPGYLPSLKGIRRFAHWAECGQQHVMIFLACLVVILWYNHALGLSVGAIAVSRFVFVWHDFKVNKRIPLGGDDQQSLYLVITGLAVEDGSLGMSMQSDEQIVTRTDGSAQEIVA